MLAEMFTIAQAARDERIRSGAIIFRDPELSVVVEENGEIQVSRRDRETPSQVLVSEMMILANALFARFLRDKKVPAPFRSQPPPSEKIELGDKHDPVASYLSRKALVRGEIMTTPAPHSTLGLDCYTTATSPLRRYPDVLVQRQIKSVLESKPYLKRDELKDILTVISYPLDRAGLMERERQRYYLLKYLRERRNEEFEAVILQRFPRFHLVRLEEFCINAPMNVSNGLSLNPYDRAIVVIDKINPREDKFSVSLVRLL
jgi:exoribonuclease-2